MTRYIFTAVLFLWFFLPASHSHSQETISRQDITSHFEKGDYHGAFSRPTIPIHNYIVSISQNNDFHIYKLIKLNVKRSEASSALVKRFDFGESAHKAELIDATNEHLILRADCTNFWMTGEGKSKNHDELSAEDYSSNVVLYDPRNNKFRNLTKASKKNGEYWVPIRWIESRKRILAKKTNDIHVMKEWAVIPKHKATWKYFLLSLDGKREPVTDKHAEIKKLLKRRGKESPIKNLRIKKSKTDNKITWNISIGTRFEDSISKEFESEQKARVIKKHYYMKQHLIDLHHLVITHGDLGTYWIDLEENKMTKLFDDFVLGINRSTRQMITKKKGKYFLIDLSNFQKWPD